MKTYTKEEFSNILNLHKKWLNGEKDGVRADLSNSDLSWTDLIEGAKFSFPMRKLLFTQGISLTLSTK